MSTPRRPDPRSSAAPITPIGRTSVVGCDGDTRANTIEAAPPASAAAFVRLETASKGLGENADKARDPPASTDAPSRRTPQEEPVPMIDLASIRTASFSLTPTG